MTYHSESRERLETFLDRRLDRRLETRRETRLETPLQTRFETCLEKLLETRHEGADFLFSTALRVAAPCPKSA